MSVTIIAHGGPYTSWEDLEKHRETCPVCHPSVEAQQRAWEKLGRDFDSALYEILFGRTREGKG